MADVVGDISSFSARETLSRQQWKIGDTYQVHTDPTVEGMVAGTKWINEVFMILFIVPSFEKKDGTKEKAAVLLRTPALCLRGKLETYTFPFPSDPDIKKQILHANGCHTLLREVVSTLNQPPVSLPSPPALTLPRTDTLPYPPITPLPDPLPINEISDDISVQLALSQAKDIPPQLPDHLTDEVVLNHLARELSQRLTFTKPPSSSSNLQPQPLLTSLPLPPPSITPPSISRRRLRTGRSSSSSKSRRTGSFSTSSTSRSSSTSKAHKVRSHTRHHSSRFYTCPFSLSDHRQLTRPSRKLPSKSEERKYLRYALHDLYNQYTTLKNFVDSLRSSLVASPTKPYTSDLIWLEHHADYLDALLLDNSTGTWTAWNETVTDKLTRAFLELTVRVSPRRKYPDLFEEPVRKWMRRRRVGIASQYGPVPAFLASARVTDTGIEPKNGWESWRPKENVPSASASGGSKGRQTPATVPEKK